MMKHSRKFAIALGLAFLAAGAAQAATPVNLDELLQQVATGRVKDAEEAQQRIEEFRADRATQQRKLDAARAEQRREEQRSANLEPPDLLIPTPLHWRRRWQRGFNQCELLCRALRRRSPALAGVPLEPGAVRRHRSTPAQSSMNARARRRNLHGAFTVRKPCAKLRAAVVDDVMTTGATAAAIARSLRDAGADRVDIWCLARTPAPT